MSRRSHDSWLSMVRDFLAGNLAVRASSAVAALILVNGMAVEEYALYTLGLSVITFLATFSDLGMTKTLLFFKRSTGQDPDGVGAYARAVLRVRSVVLMLGTCAAIPLMVQRAPAELDFGRAVVPAMVVLIPAAWWIVRAAVLLFVLRLEGRLRDSYRAEALGAGIKLGIVGLMTASGQVWAWLGLAAGGLEGWSTAYLARRMTRRASAVTEGSSKPGRAIYRDLLQQVRPVVPGALYFSLQGPLVVWLAAFFGRTRNLAEVGALSRLGQIAALLTVFVSVALLPRLALIQSEREFRKVYLRYALVVAMIAIAILGAGMLLPQLWLALLGRNYSGLHRELALLLATSGVASCVALADGVSRMRGWVRWHAAEAFVLFAIQIALIFTMDLSSTYRVLLFGLLTTSSVFVVHVAINVFGFRWPELVSLAMPGSGERSE